MAKAKNAASTAAVPTKTKGSSLPDGLGEQLDKAIALVEQKKFVEAEPAFAALLASATQYGILGLERTVRTYQSLLAQKTTKQAPAAAPELEALLLINRGEGDAALSILEKALKTHAGQAKLHYLRGLVLARKANAEASAEALKKAFELDSEFVFVYGLETDFDPMRRQPAFAALERM
jgi:tetratricopeptide (TPR) repeat protein